MGENFEIVARHRGIVLLREKAELYERSTRTLTLVNLGDTSVFVHNGLLEILATHGGTASIRTDLKAEVVAPGQRVILYPTGMFDDKSNDENEYDTLVRRLRNVGASPLTVTVSFGDVDETITANVGSLESLIVRQGEPAFDLYEVSFPSTKREET